MSEAENKVPDVFEFTGFFGEEYDDIPSPAPSIPVAKSLDDLTGDEMFGGPEMHGLMLEADIPPPPITAPPATKEKSKAEKPGLTKRLDIAKALTTVPPPRDFALPCLRIGTVGGLVSPGGAGKSMLALQLSLMLASGIDTFGGLLRRNGWENVKSGPVTYASFEDGEDDAASRLHTIWQAMGSTGTKEALERAARNLSVETLTGVKPPNLLDDGDWSQWLDFACKGKRLVVIDTLRTAHLEDENDASAMSVLLATMQGAALRNGCSVLFLHHTSKAAALGGQGTAQQAARGSSVITDNARGQFFLLGMSEDESRIGGGVFDRSAPKWSKTPLSETDAEGSPLRFKYARFGVAKSNYAAPWPEVWLRRDDRGVLSCADLVAQSGVPATSPRSSGKMKGKTLA